MKHSYIVYWEDTDPAASTIEADRGPGWYCQVSNFMPWGPFDSQAESLESMLMEWPRFEIILGSGCETACKDSCSTEGFLFYRRLHSCQLGCSNDV